MDTQQLQHDKRFFWWLNVNIFIFIFANQIFHKPEVPNNIIICKRHLSKFLRYDKYPNNFFELLTKIEQQKLQCIIVGFPNLILTAFRCQLLALVEMMVMTMMI